MNILLRTLATLTLLALTSFSTTAATRTWTGDAISNDHWTDKDNWAGDNQPVSGDILVFPSGIQNTDKGMFNTFGSGTSFQRLDFRDDGYTISGSPVRLAGGITIIIPDGDVRFDVPVKLVGNQAFQCVKTGSAGFQVGIELRPGATGAALELGSHTLTVTGTQGFVAAEGEITGTGGLTIGDGGRMLLERANSYTGLTVIRPGGKLELFHSDLDPITSSLPTLGTTDSPTHVHGTLHLFSDRDLEVAEPLKLFDGSLVEFTQDAFSAGQIDLTGPIELMGPGTMTVGRVFAPEPIVYGINGRISGSGDLVIPASDFQIAIGGSQANTFSGSFHARVRKTYLAKPAGVTALSCASVFIDPDVNHPATLQLNASHQIADTAEVNILEGGTLDLQTRAETIRALTIEGGTVDGSGSARLDVLQNISAPGANVVGTVNPELRLHADPCVLDVGDGDTADDLVFNGLVSREPGASLRKTGAGRVVFKELQAMPVELLGGVSVFAQATGVGITLNGGTLAGRGIVGVINSAAGGGRVEPGLSTGILTNGGVTWNSNTTFAVEILNTTPGTGHDQLKVLLAGVNLGGARLEVTTLPGFGAAIGQEMVIIDNDGSDSVIGGFNGLTNGAEVATASGVRFTVHYDGGTGNDVTLRTTFIPPSLVTRSWDGGDAATDNTTARDNWQPNVLPTPGDALLFPNVAKKTVQNGITAFTPFNALTFAAPGYVVNGLPIALLNGLTNTAASGTNVFNLPVRLLQDATFSSTADGKLIIGTTPVEMVNLNGHRLTLHAATTNGLVVFGQEAPLITPQDGIFGAGSVAKTGPGLATIITFNDYTGPTLVQSGTLEVQNGDALGEIGPGNGTTVAAGAALLINPLGSFGAPIREDILLDGTLRQKDDGAAVGPPLLGTLSLNLPDRLVDVPAAPLQYFGAITGPGGLRKIGAGELKLGGTNTNTFSARLLVEAGRVTLSKPSGVPAVGGPVEVTGGLLRATSNTQFGATSTLTVRFPGSADFSDTQQRFDTGIFLQGAAISNVAPLIVGGNLSTIAAATPSILEGSAAISGTSQWTVTDGAANPDLIVHSQIFDSLGGTLRKTGSGSVVFTGPNLLGLVQIDAGIALFHGSNTTSIQLNGGTLGGTGRVATVTSLANGGIVAPGAGAGILTAGNVAWNSATVFAPEVRTAIAGTGYDQLRVFGTVNLGGAALDVTVLSNFTATPTDTLVIIDNDGADAVVGTFAGLTNGASFTEVELGTGTPRTFRIAYNGGAGSNDVTLQLLAIGSGITRIWDGGGTNNNWSVNTNWDGNLNAPGVGDELVFPVGGARPVNTNNFAVGTAFDRITIRSNNYTLRGNRVSLAQGITFNFPAGSGSTVNMPVTLQQPEVFTAVGGALGTVSAVGTGGSIDNAGFPLTLHTDGVNDRIDLAGFTGIGTLTKTGPGITALSLNSHIGFTTIADGTAMLTLAGDGLGTTALGTTILPPATLFLNLVSAATMAEPFTLAGRLQFSASPVTLTGTISLPAGAEGVIDVSGNAPTLRGVISGSGALLKIGPGTLVLDGVAGNTFTGGATVAGGVLRLFKTPNGSALRGPIFIDGTTNTAELRLDAGNQILDGATVMLGGTGAVFNVNQQAEVISGLQMTGGRVDANRSQLELLGDVETFAAATPAILDGAMRLPVHSRWTVADGAAGTDLQANAGLSGGTALDKMGPGRAVFAGTNDFRTLGVVQGEAFITGDSRTALAELFGGTLGGTGIIGGIASQAEGGVVAPGVSTGILTSTTNVMWNERTTFAVELLNSTPGTGYDQLVAQGGIDLGFAQLSVTSLPGHVPMLGEQLVIIDNQTRDSVTNEFFGLPEASTLSLGVALFRISYRGGDGNDVVLTTAFVPSTGVASRWDGGAGAADQRWTTAANWEGDLAPVQGNALVFPDGPALRNTQNDFPAGTTFASLTFDGGGYTLSGNRVVLNDGLRVAAPAPEAGVVIGLPLKLAQSQMFDVATNGLVLNGGLDTAGQTVTLNIDVNGEATFNTQPISGAGGFTKTGVGQLFLNGANTYSGTTVLQGGRTIVSHAGALGTATATAIQAAELELRNTNAMTIAESFSLASPNAVLLTTNSHTINGSITLSGSGPREVRVARGATLTLNGRISGSGTLRKSDGGIVRLGGALANIYTGGTVVERGGLELAKTSSNAIPGSVVLGGPTPPGANMVLLGSNQIADAANVVLADSSILLLNSFSDQIGGLLLESASVAGASNALLILNGGLQSAGANPSVLNTPVRVTGGPRLWSIARTAGADHLEARQPISAGPGASIIKTGAGRLRCFATNSVPLMLLEAGGAVFDAANPLTAILLNGGELAGDGTVSHVTSIVGGGAVVPGLSVGVLTASNVTWNAATSFRCELDPGQSDRLTALGPVNLGSATLELALPFTAPLNYSVAILLNESGAPITGTFAGLPEGALFAVEGQVFQITYHGTNADDTDGDDVQLTRVSTPPSFLSGITILPNGLTQFSGSGVPGAIYTIEASEDLLQWSAVGTVTAESNSLYQFLDVDSLTFPHRFYRAISP